MAGGNHPMAHCTNCQLIEEMKAIPASFLPQSAITELSKILDPVKELPDNDYRYFGQKNGLLPKDVQWLDSQKTQFNTSSIAMMLKYLSDRDGDRFTIFTVYKTLVAMNSDGQRVIMLFMPEIRRLHNQGMRPGQEHAEPLSVIQHPPTNHAYPGPPTPYPDPSPSRSMHMQDRNSGSDFNNLNQGCHPQEISDLSHQDLNLGGASDPPRPWSGERGEGGGSGRADCSRGQAGPGACQVSFPTNCRPENMSSVDCQHGQREAQESSMPPSYEQSEREHNSREATAMWELKSPLPGPEVEAGCQPGPRVNWNSPPLHSSLFQNGYLPKRNIAPTSNPQFQVGYQSDRGVNQNILPVANPQSQQSISSSLQQQLPHFSMIGGRPTSYPSGQPPTPRYKNHGPSSRPTSDLTSLCSHDGACNCSTFLSSSVDPSLISGKFTPSGVAVNDGEDSMSVSVSQWEHKQQTLVKMPFTGGPGDASQQHHGMLTPQLLQQHEAQVINRRTTDREEHVANTPQRNQSGWTRSLIEEYNAEVEKERLVTPPPNDPSSNFLFIVAGEVENSTKFKQQVNAFRRRVEHAGMSYVMVHSFSHWPHVSLPPHVLATLPPYERELKAIQKFLWKCFSQASRVVMLITPGYLRYADAYTEGVEEATTFQQKLMRKIQEQLKIEYFKKKRAFRIRPILLGEMNTNRVHLPVFLGSSVYYWFPTKPNAEDVLKVLGNDLRNRSVTVKRSI